MKHDCKHVTQRTGNYAARKRNIYLFKNRNMLVQCEDARIVSEAGDGSKLPVRRRR